MKTPTLTRNEQRVLDAVVFAAGAADDVHLSMANLARVTGLDVGEVIAGMVRLRECGLVNPLEWRAPRQVTNYTLNREAIGALGSLRNVTGRETR